MTIAKGNIEKSRQRRSRRVADLRAHRLVALRDVRAHVDVYAPRVKRAAALLDGLF